MLSPKQFRYIKEFMFSRSNFCSPDISIHGYHVKISGTKLSREIALKEFIYKEIEGTKSNKFVRFYARVSFPFRSS